MSWAVREFWSARPMHPRNRRRAWRISRLPTSATRWNSDRDEVNIFRTMSNELGSPRILVCPADASTQPAQSMANLTAANISYQVEFRSGRGKHFPDYVQ